MDSLKSGQPVSHCALVHLYEVHGIHKKHERAPQEWVGAFPQINCVFSTVLELDENSPLTIVMPTVRREKIENSCASY